MVTFVAACCTHIIMLSFHSKVKFKPFGDSFPLFTYFSGYKYLPPFTSSLLDAQTIKDILNHPVGWASTPESPAHAIPIVLYVLQLHIAMHCCILIFDPLLLPRLPATFISFVLIILAQLRLCYYVSQYLTTIDLCTHLRDCHSPYNSEVCFCSQCITPVLTNPVDMINYR